MMKPPRCELHALAALIALAEIIRASPSHAQEARPAFRARVAVVPITAVVRDSRNRIVRDLSRDDFQVLENSRPRPIVDFRA
jgi:hypothetical protein